MAVTTGGVTTGAAVVGGVGGVVATVVCGGSGVPVPVVGVDPGTVVDVDGPGFTVVVVEPPLEGFTVVDD